MRPKRRHRSRRGEGGSLASRRQPRIGALVVVNGQSDLFEVVLALSPSSCLPGLLDRRKQQGDQDGNDGDDDEEFNQCEPAKIRRRNSLSHEFFLDSPRSSAVEMTSLQYSNDNEINVFRSSCPLMGTRVATAGRPIDAAFQACRRSLPRPTPAKTV